MISGEIDLSVGQVFALTAFIVYYVDNAGVPILLAVAGRGWSPRLIGLINGVITTVLGVSSFITTLGTFFLLNGMTLTISNGLRSTRRSGETYTKVSAAAPTRRSSGRSGSRCCCS